MELHGNTEKNPWCPRDIKQTGTANRLNSGTIRTTAQPVTMVCADHQGVCAEHGGHCL